MNINIKKIGNAIGTIGWLSNKFEKGEVEIRENYISGTKDLGLFLEIDKITMCLANFDNYENEYLYNVINTAEALDGRPDSVENRFNLTKAARKVLYTIAKNWCEARQEEHNKEQEYTVDVAFDLAKSNPGKAFKIALT